MINLPWKCGNDLRCSILDGRVSYLYALIVVGIPQEANALAKLIRASGYAHVGGANRGKSPYANIMSNSTNKFFEDLAWDNIVWARSYKTVRRMQKRIFQASQKGQLNRVHFLQKILLQSPHAKLIAIQKVTTLNKGRKTAGVDKIILTTPSDKLNLAKTLQLNGKANLIRRVWIPKPGKTERRPLGIPTINDRAKQALAALALEPQWEAKFEANSYGFRPGRRAHDAIEAIFSNLHHGVDKLVFDADIRKCFDRIDHSALLNKLETFPLMHNQVQAWLKAGIMDAFAKTEKISTPYMGTPQGDIISPLLSNIALHGLEDHLLKFVSTRKMPKPHPGAATGVRAKRSALGIVRYADDFVIIHRNPIIMEMVIQETRAWLEKMGLEISEEKSALRLASHSFNFLGFSICYVYNKQDRNFRVKITPSKENVARIISKVKLITTQNKAASSYQLIEFLRPVLIGWGNYFQFCECKDKFSRVDNIIWQILRSWVFRRANRTGRMSVKEKYFPSGNEYNFQGRLYKANWILNGIKKPKKGVIIKNHLPKLSWIKSRKFVKVRGTCSVYDGNETYWAIRTPRYTTLSTRVTNLLNRQKGKCAICQIKFGPEDVMEVDHVIPRSKGGIDSYINLQLLHRQCHIHKTQKDLCGN